MSLGAFYTGLARMAGDPARVRAVRSAGPSALGLDDSLTDRESARLGAMAADPRMSVMCSLYRSNRLTALVRTVPGVVAALGDQLADVVTDFWRVTPRTDMQFLSESRDFCDFVRTRFADDGTILAAVATAEVALRALGATPPSAGRAS